MRYTSLISIFILLFIFSCREDTFTVSQTNPIGSNPGILYEREYNGIVQDDSGKPLEGVTVSSGNSVDITNSDGSFRVIATTVDDRAFIKAEASGYFDAFADLVASKKGVGHVRFQLETKQLIGQLNSSSGGSIQLLNGSGVQFTPGPLRNVDMSEYEGVVNVFARYLDPKGEEFHELFPGNLNAIDNAGNSRILESFGMLQIELEDQAGNELNLIDSAIITTAIPDELVSKAPQKIPLWYFDEKQGPWIEDGYAKLEGDEYVGKVSHFSIWNCDVPFTPIDLSGTLLSPFGIIENHPIKFTWVEESRTEKVYSSDLGEYSIKIPEGATVLVEIFSHCLEKVYESEIGPFSADHSEDIIINIDQEEFLSIEGHVTCENVIISNGYVVIDFNNHKVISSVDENGWFHSELLICHDEFDLYAVDLDAALQGNLQTFEIAPPFMDLDTIEACIEEIIGFLRFHHSDGVYEIYTLVEAKAVFIEDDLLKSAAIKWIDIQSQGNIVEGTHVISEASYSNIFYTTITGNPAYDWEIYATENGSTGFEYTLDNGYINFNIEVENNATFYNKRGPEEPTLEWIEIRAKL